MRRKGAAAVPEKDVGFLIKGINDKLKVKADADLKRYNLTFAQSRVFVYLDCRGGQATQKEIEVFLGVSHPTVVGVVSRMEQNGYVTCWQDEDRRNKIVCLTERAQEISIEMTRHMQETEQKLLSPLSPAEAESLKDMLLRIYERLE